MKTKLLALLFSAACSAGSLAAATADPYAAVHTALAQNQLDAAETALTPLVSVERPEPQALVLLSQVRARQNRAKEAVTLAERAIEIAPTDARLHAHLGRVLGQRIGEVNFLHQGLLAPQLRRAFEKSVELDPNLLDGYVGLARYYTNAPAIAGGGREPAERYARELEKRNPQLGTLELAAIAERFDDPATAATLYAKAAAAQPDSAAIQASLGRVNESLQKPDDARACYAKALALDPNLTSAKTALARLDAPKN